MQGLKVEQLDGYLWVTATRIGDKLRLDYRVDDATSDGRDFYDGDDDLTDWTDDQLRALACDMLSIDHDTRTGSTSFGNDCSRSAGFPTTNAAQKVRARADRRRGRMHIRAIWGCGDARRHRSSVAGGDRRNYGRCAGTRTR